MNLKNIATGIVVFSFLFNCGCTDLNFFPDDCSSNLVEIKNVGNFTTIQDAINAASDRDTIIVHQGIYHETIIIDKEITIIGKEKGKAIVRFDEGKNDENVLIHINADNCVLKNLTLENKADFEVIGLRISSSNNEINNMTISNMIYGIYLFKTSSNNYISYNNLRENSGYGILVSSSSFNNIYLNNISNNERYGIEVLGTSYNNSEGNIILENIISSNERGIHLKSVSNNFVVRNIIADNDFGIYVCCSSNNNSIYYNSFLRNKEHSDVETNRINFWDYEGKGNFWDDYTEKNPNATTIDGIWDTPYLVSSLFNNFDMYPLVDPL